MKLTKNNIEEMAMKIKDFLIKNGCEVDVCIYFNDKRIKDINEDGTYTLEENMNPFEYFDYANDRHILSMSFEGTLYHALNYYYNAQFCDKITEGLRLIVNEYGLYYEMGDAWNLSCYANNEDYYADIEYTDYRTDPSIEDMEQHIGMFNIQTVPKELAVIMKAWYDRSAEVGDEGSCVIGAGFHFKYDGGYYYMSSCSPWQGSLSWENTKDRTEEMLRFIGAEDIRYDYGIMD